MSRKGQNGKAQREQALIKRVRSGDAVATRDLVDQHKDRLYAFIRRMVRHHHDAEEICQEAFLKAFGSLDSYSTDYRFSTWLFTIGYRVCLNWLRRKKALTGELDFGAMPSPEAGDTALAIESEELALLKHSVWSAVDQLSAPQRASILLFYRHEMSCSEIAQVLALPVATVKSHLHRARARLRDVLEPLVSGEVLGQFRNLAG